MDFQMIDEIKAETKMFKFIDLISVFMIMGFVFFGLILSNFVYNPLQIPFIIFNGLIGMVFSLNSRWNRGKKIWQSLLLFIKNIFSNVLIYHAIEHEIYEEDIIQETQLMFNSKYQGVHHE